MGRIKFTNTDSSGNPVTERLTVTIDGERQTIEVASTGTAQVSEDVEKHLVKDGNVAIESYNSSNN